MSLFADRFRLLKEEKNMILKEMAAELGITVPNLSYYMKGREPNYDTLIKIADYFNVSVDWLVGRSDTRKQAQNSFIENIEKEVEENDPSLLHGIIRDKYMECIDSIYENMENLYTILSLLQDNEDFDIFCAENIADVVHTITNFYVQLQNIYYLADGKDSMMEFTNFMELTAESLKRHILSISHQYAIIISECCDMPSEEERNLTLGILQHNYEVYKKLYSYEELKKIYEELNNICRTQSSKMAKLYLGI